MNEGAVSVVVTTHYRNERLKRALRSVRAQTYEPLEIVVVDDSGDDHARPVVSEIPDVTYVAHDQNRGAHAARNTGLEQTTGEFVQLLDDDDQLKPEKIAKQVALLEETDSGVVYCGKEWESGDTMLPNPEVRGNVLEHCLMFSVDPYVTSTMLSRREILQQVAPFPTGYGGADDIVTKIDLARITTVDFVNEPLVIAGQPDETLGTSWSSVEGRKKILEEYAYLYDELPIEVRKQALTDYYQRKGRRHLNDSAWSGKAIFAFGLAAWHSPDTELAHIGELVTSFGGRPVRTVVTRVWRIVSG